MSYYESNYYQNPGPFYASSDFDAPVPGWGVLPSIAGAQRVAVGAAPGQVISPEALKKLSPEMRLVIAEGTEKKSPAGRWVMWIGAGAAVGAGVAFAQNQGWLGRVGLKR